MRKFFGLYHNELIKIYTKVSVIILFIIMIIAMVGTACIMRITYNETKQFITNDNSNDYMIDNLKMNLSSVDSQLLETQRNLATASEEEKLTLKQDEITFKYQKEMYETAINKNDKVDGASWISNVYNSVAEKKAQIEISGLIREELKSEEDKKNIEDLKVQVEKLTKIRDDKDYSGYLAFSDEIINKNQNYSPEEKKIYLDSNMFRKKQNPNGDINLQNLEMTIYDLQQTRLSLQNNVDESGSNPKPLSPKKRAQMENKVAVGLYNLNKNMNTPEDFSSSLIDFAMPSIISAGIFFLSIMLIMVAGSTISGEISTGSIKSLIISPMKRNKIYTAKILAIVTTAVVSLLAIYFVGILTNQIVFGTQGVKSFISANNGVAYELNFYLYHFLRTFIMGITVLTFAIFALMLSTLTRNTAVSVGVSIAALFVGEIAMQAINQLFTGAWIKFIPYANINLENRIFINYDLINMTGMDMVKTHSSLNFSIIYLVVALGCMLYMGYDSFIRRDIK